MHTRELWLELNLLPIANMRGAYCMEKHIVFHLQFWTKSDVTMMNMKRNYMQNQLWAYGMTDTQLMQYYLYMWQCKSGKAF